MDITALLDSDIAYGSDTPARIGLQPGGVAANTAAWMALGGHPVALIGCIGADDFGIQLRERLARIGIATSLQVCDLPTGTCMVIVDRRRERTMFPDSGANAALALEQVQSVLAPGDHLHLSGYTFMNPQTRESAQGSLDLARHLGCTVSFDPASAAPARAQLPLIRSVISMVDVVLANESEAAVLTGEDEPHLALQILAETVSTAVVKLGSRGAIACRDGLQVERAAIDVDVIDTTGAGDAFTAGFLPAWLAGEPLGDCIDSAQTVAVRSVTRVGASPLAD